MSSGESGRHFLLFLREETIYAQPFDLQSLQLTGSAVPVFNRSSGVNTATPGFLNISASTNGRLLDGGVHEAKNTLDWLAPSGAPAGAVFPPGDYMTPRAAPDESKIAVTQVDAASGNFDIWVFGNPADRPRRMTSSPGIDYYPIWALDGKSIYYSSDHLAHAAIFQLPLDASTPPKLISALSSANLFPYDVSPDGKHLLATAVGSADAGNIMLVPLDGGAPRPLIAASNIEHHGHFSRGANAGRWIVYTSNESGTWQVYVRRLTASGVSEAKSQVSTVRGLNPKWKADESAIYFLGPNNRMMSAAVRISGETIDIGQPRELFDSKFLPVPVTRYSYDLGSKTGRLLLMKPQPAKRAAGMDLIMNWTLLLNRPTQ